MKTPLSKWVIAGLSGLFWLTAPLVEYVYYNLQQSRGAYPRDADTIAIPIYQFAYGWLYLTPVALLVISLVVWKYRGGLSFLAYNSKRFWWSLIVTVLVGGLAVEQARWAFLAFWDKRPVDAVQALLFVYLLLCVRSSWIPSVKKD